MLQLTESDLFHEARRIQRKHENRHDRSGVLRNGGCAKRTEVDCDRGQRVGVSSARCGHSCSMGCMNLQAQRQRAAAVEEAKNRRRAELSNGKSVLHAVFLEENFRRATILLS